jgi:hypothetical protein
MLRKCRTCAAVLTLMGLLLASVPAAEAGARGPLSRRAVGAVNGIYESFLVWTWQWIGLLGEKNGACIDPDGRCKQGGLGSTPGHRRRPRPLGEKQGACIDPNGRCKQDGLGSTPGLSDNGGCIDPNGATCAFL